MKLIVEVVVLTRQVHTCWIICEKVRKNGHQATHLGTSQNNLGTPLGVPTLTLGTPGRDKQTSEETRA